MKHPVFGIVLALFGALVITPDTLLIRLSGLEGWSLTAWRGLLCGISLILFWSLLTRGRFREDLEQMKSIPFGVICISVALNNVTFNFAVVETSVTVVLTAIATGPILAAGLSFFLLKAVALGNILSGIIGLISSSTDALFNGLLWPVLLMGFGVMPIAMAMLSLAPRYTAATNVSLFMLLELVLGPFWVWLGTNEQPSPMMILGAGIVLVTLLFYFLTSAKNEV